MRPRTRRSLKTITLPLLVAAAMVAPSVPGSAADDAPPDDPHGNVWNILTPGSRGNVDAVDMLTVLSGGGTTAVDGENAPAAYADQLEMYDALTTLEPDGLTRDDLDSLYKRESFQPEQVVSTATPRPGVRIERDGFRVPYITGETYRDTMFGAGYAAIEDRMFVTDVLRHTGAARMAEFVGDTPANVAMDQAQLRTVLHAGRGGGPGGEGRGAVRRGGPPPRSPG